MKTKIFYVLISALVSLFYSEKALFSQELPLEFIASHAKELTTCMEEDQAYIVDNIPWNRMYMRFSSLEAPSDTLVVKRLLYPLSPKVYSLYSSYQVFQIILERDATEYTIGLGVPRDVEEDEVVQIGGFDDLMNEEEDNSSST